MTLRIVHLSTSPLAGQPYRIVKALSNRPGLEIHLIDLNRWNIYPHDLVFIEETDQCIEIIKNADILHFHNYLNLDSSAFSPINFREMVAKGKSIIRQIHSEPNALSKVMGIPAQDIIDCDLPTLVIAQYPERFFPNAYVIRNNIPLNDPDYLPAIESCQYDLFFSPSKRISAWDDRWNTKGAPETYRLMKKVARATGCTYKMVTKQPLSTVLREKKQSHIVLDDMITGSYHLSGLEGISMAKPTLAYLDNRIQFVLREVSGSSSTPFINVMLENSDAVLKYLLSHPDEGMAVGLAGREWLERYWSEELIMDQFIDVYHKLLFDPGLIIRQENLRIETMQQRFYAINIHDLIYESRNMHHQNIGSRLSRLIRNYIK